MGDGVTPDVLRALFDAIPLGIKVWRLEAPEDPASLRLMFSNPSASDATGVPREMVIGKTIAEGFPDAVTDGIAETFANVIRNGEAVNLGEITYSDPRVREGVFSITAFPLPEQCVGVAFTNVTKEKLRIAAIERKASFVALLKEVAMAANQARTAAEAFQQAVDGICAHTRWPVGHVYLRERADSGLQPSDVWHLADLDRYAQFRNATRQTPLRPGVGLPGRVLESGRPAWLSDLQQDDRFPEGKFGDLNLRAGFAFPVLVGADVAAVLEFYSPASMLPDELILEVMEQIGIQLGRVVERERASRISGAS